LASLVYSVIASLDGYVEDEEGTFDWAEPDEEVLRFINDLERPIGTHLYGRRMYETMLAWETAPVDETVQASVRDFTQIWRSAAKVVYSRTLESVSSDRTRVESDFDPEVIRRLKATESRPLCVGGAELAGQAIEAGLVDELQLLVVPVIVGGGKSWLPKRVRITLELKDHRRFASGVTFLSYRPAP
jgi:dihydrofolate reductase